MVTRDTSPGCSLTMNPLLELVLQLGPPCLVSSETQFHLLDLVKLVVLILPLAIHELVYLKLSRG